MNSSLPIGPYDPHMPHQQWHFPNRPAPSSIESRSHEIALRAIHTSTPEGSLTRGDRIAYDKELCTWLEDVHTLCLNILNGKEKETDSLKVDLTVIQKKIGQIHQEIDERKFADEDGGSFLRSDVAQRLHTVESDLENVQQIQHFSTLYEKLENSIEHWNSLAEHPYHPNGECLQENAHDSLNQYVQMQTMFTELKGIRPRSPEQDKLLQEVNKDLKRIQQTFTQAVLPALKEKLEEAKKNYQQAAKAMDKSGVLNRWTQDTATVLMTNFANFQHTLADVRYQAQAIEAACSKLPASTTSQALSQLLAASTITGKSIETAEASFIKRLAALPPEEKAQITTSLANVPQPGDVAFITKAFLQRIYEIVSQQVPVNPYFQEIAATAKQLGEHISPDLSSARELYHITLSSQYFIDTVNSQQKWQQQEDALIAELEKAPSLWKQRGLGAFFLLLHAGAAVHNIQRMQKEAAALPGRADRLQQELILLAGKRAARGAAFIGTMLSDKYEDLRTMSEVDLQRMTKRFPDDVRETLEAFRMGAAKPSPEQIFEIHQRYVLQHANPTLKEQISNWYTQLTTSQIEEMPPESIEAQSAAIPAHDSLALSSKVNLNAYLLDAVGKGNLEHAQRWIEVGADPNVKDSTGNTPLSLAFASWHEEMILELLKAGGDPNGKTPDGIPFIQTAIELNGLEVFKALIAHGADPNVKDEEGNSLLSIAFSRWNPNDEIVLELLKAGGDPNGKTLDGTPFLQKAIEYNRLEVFKALIEHGADPNSENDQGHTPLSIALAQWDPHEAMIVELLKAGGDPNGKTPNGTPFIHKAIERDMFEVLKALIEHAADPNSKDGYGHTPLSVVFANDDPDETMIIELIKAGGDPNGKTPDGTPFIHMAIEWDKLEILKALIAHGASVNILDDLGKPPLLYAENEATAKVLLEAGASLITPDGTPILNIAIKEKKWDLVRALLVKGALSKKPTLDVVESLVAGAPEDCVRVLLQRIKSADYPEVFNPSVFFRFGRFTFLPALLDQGLNIDLPDRNGMTALHWAYLLNLPDAAQFLLVKGANAEAVNRFGMRPAAFISDENTLKHQVEATAQQLVSREFPPEVLTKLQGKAVNKGMSETRTLHALPLLPAPLNASSLDANIADLALPTAISKVESLRQVRDSIPLKTGALRQRLGALTGRYLDKLFMRHPISGIQGFFVPETIIEPDVRSSTPVPTSVTRFVSSSVDMKETTDEGISKEEWTKLLVLDMILGNTDRHVGNYRVQTTLNERGEPLKRIIPIDHDLTLPDLTSHDEYVWGYLRSVSDAPFSEEWKNFILGIDPDALWKEYEREAAAYGAAYADYTQGETGINDDVYLNFQARIKALQEGVQRGWSPNAIGKIFTQAKCKVFFNNDNPKETREERKARIFDNIANYFTANKSERLP